MNTTTTVNSRTFQREFAAACQAADAGRTVVVVRGSQTYTFRAENVAVTERPRFANPKAARLWALTEKAHAGGMELWNDRRILEEIKSRRGGAETHEDVR